MSPPSELRTTARHVPAERKIQREQLYTHHIFNFSFIPVLLEFLVPRGRVAAERKIKENKYTKNIFSPAGYFTIFLK